MALLRSIDYMAKEDKFGAHNYHPLPVVLAKGTGIMLGTWKEINILISCLHIQQLTRGTATQKLQKH